MTKIEKILIPVILLAALGSLGLWMNELKTSTVLSRELQSKQQELDQAEAVKRGLQTANNQLQARLNKVEAAAVALRSFSRRNDPLFEEITEPSEVSLALEFVETPESDEDPNQPTILSPEEVAAKKERDEKRQAERAEREQRRKEFRERVTSELAVRMDFFSQINTDGLAPEYVEAHQKLMESLMTTGVLIEQISDPDLSREERREIGRDLWGKSREIEEYMDMQRDVLLNDYAELSLGLTGEQTQAFIQYMQTVNEMTSGSPMRGGGGRRGR